jgi:hypothetical protein
MLRHRPIVGIILIIAGPGIALAQPVPVPPGAGARASGAGGPVPPNMSCGQEYSPRWDNCIGLVRYPNGNVYQGEFHHGQRDGLGFIVINATGVSDQSNILSKEPSIYAGEFRADRLNGHGVWFTRAGAGYSGTFIDNLPQPDVAQKNCSGPPPAWSDCVAAVRYGNGNLYRGEFMHGQRDGLGMLVIEAMGSSDSQNIRMPATPAVYVGEFKDDRLDGRGMVFMRGAGFYGIFTDNILQTPSQTVGAPGPPSASSYPPITYAGR